MIQHCQENQNTDKLIKENIDQIDQRTPIEIAGAVTRDYQVHHVGYAYSFSDGSFYFNESKFKDTLQLWYGKELKRLPTKCPYGQKFDFVN